MRWRDKFQEDMRIRNYSERTIENYMKWNKRFFEWAGKAPLQVTRDDVRAFLFHLIHERGVSAECVGHYRSALKFLYEVTLGRPMVVERIPTQKRKNRLPNVLSFEDVEALLAAATSCRNRVILTLMYGAGLRITEACSLRVGDIDSKRMQIHVHEGKGRRDRYVMLPIAVLELLRKYWRMAKPDDYMFPGQKKGRHITPQNIRREFHNARRAAGITKKVSPHCLRHSFATHLVDSGVDLQTLQALLGHSCISTTSVYIRTSNKRIRDIVSPLDAAPDEDRPDDDSPVQV